MTLEDLADIAQIVASFGVIVSLIYLARQVVQNTRMMRASVSNDRVARDFDLSGALCNNREFAELWWKGQQNLAGLDDLGRVRVVMHSRSALKHWQNMFSLRQQGLVSDSDWNELKWLIRYFGAAQVTQEAWKIFGDSFGGSFQKFMEEQLALAGHDETNG
jgi:hypothetical protein